jgi:ribonuclease P protein component
VTATLSFPRDHRLTDKPAFDRVFDSAARSGDQYFTVLYTANELTHPRVGLVVSKKVSKRAVDRNRLRRVVRESFRAHQHEIQHHDFVVLARSAAKLADNAQLRASLEKHWRNAAA